MKNRWSDRLCRPSFFPLREPLGFDARELTPTLVLKVTRAVAEARSFACATTAMNDVAGRPVSVKRIEGVVHDVRPQPSVIRG